MSASGPSGPLVVRGVQVRLTKKSTDNVFFSPQLILQKSMANFKEIYHFSRFQRGPTFSRGGGGGGGGGPIFSRGVQLLIPYRNPYDL